MFIEIAIGTLPLAAGLTEGVFITVTQRNSLMYSEVRGFPAASRRRWIRQIRQIRHRNGDATSTAFLVALTAAPANTRRFSYLTLASGLAVGLGASLILSAFWPSRDLPVYLIWITAISLFGARTGIKLREKRMLQPAAKLLTDTKRNRNSSW